MTDQNAACPSCDGTGWEPVPDSKVRKVRHCERCEYWDRARGTAPGIPESEREATLANYDRTPQNQDALKHAALFVEGVHQGLYLHGPVGVGKTRLACSILNDAWKKGTRVRFIRVPELLVRLTPHTGNGEEMDALITSLVEAPVLCLDDIGANSGSDYSRRMVQVLTDARSDRGNRTIWTSNLTPDELGEFLADERLPSRIVGSCRVVVLKGPDQRTLRKPKPTKPAVQANLKGSKW